MMRQAQVHEEGRRALRRGLAAAVAATILLALVHLWLGDFEAGGVHWFHLDRERNLPTWFSGVAFLSIGLAALVAYTRELQWLERHERPARPCRPWLVVALIAFALSLDEVTVLHENLFWREFRRVTFESQGPLRFVTQWQALFAPLIVLLLLFFVSFFAQRFAASRPPRTMAYGGIGCWILALAFEGARGLFKLAGEPMYRAEVVAEEMLELWGALLIAAAIARYGLDIAWGESGVARQALSGRYFLAGRRSLLPAVVTALALISAGAGIYSAAREQQRRGAPLPHLFERALGSS
ncbi:MAG TPA: hypothetical protein ENK10_10585, partial [Acidobacteria bacterium]|nr:hypothetical protein [Acidobacteriota bacterium]